MRILYIAKHNQPQSNDDEGSISCSLQSLGHIVHIVKENRLDIKAFKTRADIMLFHHWNQFGIMKSIGVPKVFWNFDLVDFKDSTMNHRTEERIHWMNQATEIVRLGFCSDGDWVHKDTTGKLLRLTQGSDPRIKYDTDNPLVCSNSTTSHYHGHDNYGQPVEDISILFTGSTKVGQRRESFVAEMRNTYGDKFHQVGGRLHGERLRAVISRSQIVVAPDGPASNYYWSNRVYLMLGYGAFLIHPYCETLTYQYEDKKEIVYYHSREELHHLIDYYQDKPEERAAIAQAGLDRTRKEHTYLHRCKDLIKVVQSRLNLSTSLSV